MIQEYNKIQTLIVEQTTQNNVTWEPQQNHDMKFILDRCAFHYEKGES